jgi:hypothetical protein
VVVAVSAVSGTLDSPWRLAGGLGKLERSWAGWATEDEDEWAG